ncbi:MAG: L-threonylcarbamoyladenylate synthase [Endomicrobia bacterium]|nr:L-threonylcarbamoyladenylate synthase [Endomicrobiia bacterium]MDW8055706.1 L-threonylcarbamoyladenylate synthase [Elusimicrobiota bacterium]
MKIIDLTKNNSRTQDRLLPAVDAIKNGNLVVIPTETVYGLAADCFNISAVNKIFLVKNRPYSDPLIVHISNLRQLHQVVKYIPENAKKIIKVFWPGAVSLVLYKKSSVPDIVTAGLKTVCIRMPENEVTRKFIELCGTPLAVPSANIFSRVSATDISHIIKDFDGVKEIKYVIYTGRPKYGIESTVIDCTSYPFRVLRYGAVDIEEIKKKCKVEIIEQKRIFQKKSPGMFKKHYAPIKPTYVSFNITKYIKTVTKEELNNVTIVCSKKTKDKLREILKDGSSVITYGNTLKEIAKNLYLCLRLAEEMDTKKIVVEATKMSGLGKTIMDRLLKASEGKIV